MSILIRSNVHLPRSCRKCPFNGGDWCIASEKVRIGKHGNVNEHRHPDCPLVEIPTPHGRLIDVDKLKCPLSWQGEIVRATVRETPTIIEAEE